MSSSNKNKNICYACGEDLFATGNYHMKILPSKRIPLKVQKLIQRKQMTGIEDATFKKFKEGRFKKYFKDVRPQSVTSNLMEVSCGVCQSVSKIHMRKAEPRRRSTCVNLNASTTATPTQTSSQLNTPLSKRQKKRQRQSKTPKELNAGLFIPASMSSSSTRTLSDEPKPKRIRLEPQRRSEGTPLSGSPMDSTWSGHSGTAAGTRQSRGTKVSKANVPPPKSLNTMTEAQKRRQVDNLRKTLFKSKQNFDSSAPKSLQDFLS